jgi:hypothetical protein
MLGWLIISFPQLQPPLPSSDSMQVCNGECHCKTSQKQGTSKWRFRLINAFDAASHSSSCLCMYKLGFETSPDSKKLKYRESHESSKQHVFVLKEIQWYFY